MMYRDSLLLTGEKWSELDDNQKVEVLQTIENHVAFESHRIPCQRVYILVLTELF